MPPAVDKHAPPCDRNPAAGRRLLSPSNHAPPNDGNPIVTRRVLRLGSMRLLAIETPSSHALACLSSAGSGLGTQVRSQMAPPASTPPSGGSSPIPVPGLSSESSTRTGTSGRRCGSVESMEQGGDVKSPAHPPTSAVVAAILPGGSLGTSSRARALAHQREIEVRVEHACARCYSFSSVVDLGPSGCFV